MATAKSVVARRRGVYPGRMMRRILASPFYKCIVVFLVLLALLGFGYHVVHNLKRAGLGRQTSDDRPLAPQTALPPPRPLPYAVS